MGNGPEIPADWTELERRVWERIAVGEPADLNARPDQKNLDPHTEDGWSEDRRLTAKFFQDILMQKAFVEATPSGGVRILGALIDDAPLNLEHARLQHHFWLEESRILTDVNCLYLRVAGVLSLEKCFVAGAVDLSAAEIGSALFRNATFKGGLTLTGAKISSELAISQSTFEADVSLDSTTVGGHALLLNATFEAGLGMAVAKIGSNLLMSGATFEGNVNVNSATVGGHALLRRVTVKGALDLTAAKIGAGLDMSASTFGRVSLNAAKVGRCCFSPSLVFQRYARPGDGQDRRGTGYGRRDLRGGRHVKRMHCHRGFSTRFFGVFSGALERWRITHPPQRPCRCVAGLVAG